MNSTAPTINIQHDGKITIAVGRSRKDTQWRNRQMLWSQLVRQLQEPTKTQETFAEYQSMPKRQRDEIKDVGGFVGGVLKEGRRKADAVVWRHLVTLDADNVTGDLWASVELLFDFACVLYSTHSHSPEKPRLRLVVPLKRPVTAEEYQPVARWLANGLGMDNFDGTTFEAHRLMYWPSVSRDGEYVFRVQDGEWLDPDEVLATYPDWRDPSCWPESPKETKERKRQAEKQGDPREKQGLVGAFCRTYSIEEAIEKFLSDIYEPCGERRYTYIPGSSTGGLVVYDDGKFAYSHHGTDPISGKLVNSFDLVRLHKFGALDDDAEPGTPTVRLPSYQAMLEFAAKDERVKQTLGEEQLAQAKQEFGDVPDEQLEWVKELERHPKTGMVMTTFRNFELILENDPNLKGAFAYDQFFNRPTVRKPLPWRKEAGRPMDNADYAAVRGYIENVYGIRHEGRLEDALTAVQQKNAFHPVREYLDGLEWDGVPRLDTVFVDYLGVEDNEHIKKLTRMALVAAVARIYNPGTKFDHVIVFVGPQGIGKSSVIAKLSKGWYTDSLDSLSGKEAYEALQGSWLVELAELSAVKRAADVETVKKFLSKTSDKYRPPYARVVEEYPRQCVFFGTTNTYEFLADRTGNRRFWPFRIVSKPAKSWSRDLTEQEIDQIWAEAVTYWKEGCRFHLDPYEDAETIKWLDGRQLEHTEESSLTGMIREFLDMPLPEDWEDRDIPARRAYINSDFGEAKGTKRRDKVCVMEVWVELLGKDPATLDVRSSREIGAIIENTPGWKRHGTARFGSAYGRQRAFVRESKG